MRWGALVPAVLLAVGAVLVALAALQGAARLAVVVVVPVVFGSSIEFVVGVLLLLAGLFSLGLAFEPAEETDEPGVASPPRTSSGGGGLVLVGPVPLFFGAWRDVPARTRILVAILGAAVFAVAVLVVLGFLF
ncbi:MAG: DUF131 domain-containing protein [Thermoplasmata archaeon]